MTNLVKHALVDHPEHAYIVAQKIGKSDVWMSMVARGRIEPSHEDKERLAGILKKKLKSCSLKNIK